MPERLTADGAVWADGSHEPLDLVVVLLGTCDLKRRFDIGVADVAAGLAERAAEGGWTHPKLVDHACFEVAGGRHPVVEAALARPAPAAQAPATGGVEIRIGASPPSATKPTTPALKRPP